MLERHQICTLGMLPLSEFHIIALHVGKSAYNLFVTTKICTDTKSSSQNEMFERLGHLLLK